MKRSSLRGRKTRNNINDVNNGAVTDQASGINSGMAPVNQNGAGLLDSPTTSANHDNPSSGGSQSPNNAVSLPIKAEKKGFFNSLKKKLATNRKKRREGPDDDCAQNGYDSMNHCGTSGVQMRLKPGQRPPRSRSTTSPAPPVWPHTNHNRHSMGVRTTLATTSDNLNTPGTSNTLGRRVMSVHSYRPVGGKIPYIHCSSNMSPDSLLPVHNSSPLDGRPSHGASGASPPSTSCDHNTDSSGRTAAAPATLNGITRNSSWFNQKRFDPVYQELHEPTRAWSLTKELFRLSKFGWYWGPLSRAEAEDKLAYLPDGAFLVRDSSDERYLLSLSFRSYGKTLHTRIEHLNGVFSFYALPECEGYNSIVDLIENSVRDSKAGVFCYSRSRSPNGPSFPVRLTSPVSRFTQVRTLQYLCRFVIRQYTRLDHIQKLPLPTSIKGWLEESQF